MAANKKRKTKPAQLAPSRWQSARQFLLPRARVLISIGVVLALGLGLHGVWTRVAPSIIYRDTYLLDPDRVTISTPPEWLSADVRTEVIRNAGLSHRLSILDDAFMNVVQDAFTLHPWVLSVDRITKKYPPGAHVEVTYRQPVAVVELASPQGVLFVPVDSQAVHLPIDDVPDLRKRYLPRIGGIVGRPPVGQQWDDPRVRGAAELAHGLSDDWEAMHLVDILPSARPEIRDEHRFFVYDLITRGGTRVVWGPAPSAAPPGEHAFDVKLERLKECVRKHGPLDSVHSPAIVDVRTGLDVTPRTVQKKPPADEESALLK